jgi:dipeptidyl aminopeptidase/acylaminoacyl peptidase
MTNTGDSYQLYAWDVPTGQLTQLTNRAEGVPLGVLSPDGRYVYYLDDRQGNEIGHFEKQIWGDLGHREIEDMVAARDWLVQQGMAKPDQIFLTGWSYGGYLTLLGLGKRPDLWAGGMAGIAIADWTMSFEDSADTLRGYQLALFGGTPEEKPDLYRRASPITYVEQVSAPVLIIQGRNDTRTPARPIRAYEARMQELGKPVEVQWFDAGHLAFTRIEQSIDQYESMLRFAYKVLDSRWRSNDAKTTIPDADTAF